jgi:transcriptional regulator with XRE-family HTH domain
MTKATRRNHEAQQPAATNDRSFRTFLLMAQLQAREIGARIKQRRLERGLTQPELAAMASFSTRSLQDYENGVTIPYRHLPEIGKLLNTEPVWFLYGQEEQPDEDRLSRLAGEVGELRDLLERVLEARGETPEQARGRAAEGS